MKKPLFFQRGFLRNTIEMPEGWRLPVKRKRTKPRRRWRGPRKLMPPRRRRIPPGVDWAQINGKLCRLDDPRIGNFGPYTTWDQPPSYAGLSEGCGGVAGGGGVG